MMGHALNGEQDPFKEMHNRQLITMFTTEVIGISQLDLSQITFTKLFEKAHKIKRTYLNYRGNGKILVQFPKMALQFNVKYVDHTGHPSYNISFSMDKPGMNNIILDLEEKLIDHANEKFMKRIASSNLSRACVTQRRRKMLKSILQY